MKVNADHNYYVYILTNKTKTVLYTGMTNDLKTRVYQHQNPDALSRSFTTRYRCYYLIYHENYRDVHTSIKREKQIKGWSRIKKEALISKINPDWMFIDATRI